MYNGINVSQTIILASQSKNRKAIMDTLSIPYVIIPSGIDEKSVKAKNVQERVKKIARKKAEKVLNDYPEAIVIAADSYIVSSGKPFEKPETLVEARKMLLSLSGKKCVFYTGVCYVDKHHSIELVTTTAVSIEFRKLTEDEVERYVRTFPVLNWAGGMSPHHPEGAAMIKELNGSLSSFIYGLPIDIIIQCLQKSGVLGK